MYYRYKIYTIIQIIISLFDFYNYYLKIHKKETIYINDLSTLISYIYKNDKLIISMKNNILYQTQMICSFV